MSGTVHAVGPQLPDELPQLDVRLSALLHGVQTEFLWQAARMPAVSRRLLLEHEEPSGAISESLLSELHLSEDTVSLDAPMLSAPVLSPEACATLRNAVDRERQSKVDSVDGAPDEQLNLSHHRLAELIGTTAVSALWRLPAQLLRYSGRTVDTRDARIFVRRYTPQTRPWTPFHVDSARVTINVALSDETACAGGDLLTLLGTGVRAVRRAEGVATIHSSNLLHGVSRLASGLRHTLIIFVGSAAPRLPADLRFDGPTARVEEAAALATLMSTNGTTNHGDGALVMPNGLRDAYEGMLARSRKRRRAKEEDEEEALAQAERVGAQIERVVQHYAAPHLRPTNILARTKSAGVDGALSSLRALMNYAAEEDVEELRNDELCS